MSTIKDRVRVILQGSPILSSVILRGWPLHGWTHEAGGIDEISIADLEGVTADDQHAGWIRDGLIDPNIDPSNGDVLIFNGTFWEASSTLFEGVTSLNGLTDDVVITEGAGIDVGVSGQNIQITNTGVLTLAEQGGGTVSGAVTVSEGDGISIVRSGQNFEFSNTGVLSVSSNDNSEQISGNFRLVEGENCLIDALDDNTGFKIACPIAALIYTAASIAVDPSYGTYISGDVDSTFDPQDGDYYAVGETETTPALIVGIDYTSVTLFDLVEVYFKYNGGTAGLTGYVQLYNNNTSSYDNLVDFQVADTWQLKTIRVVNSAPYVNGSNEASLRFSIGGTGVSGNDLQIEYAVLQQSAAGTPSGVISVNGKTGVLTVTSPDGSIAVTSGGTYDIDIAVAEVDESLITGLTAGQVIFGAADGTIGQVAGFEYDPLMEIFTAPTVEIYDGELQALLYPVSDNFRIFVHNSTTDSAIIYFDDDILDGAGAGVLARFADNATEVSDFITTFTDVSIFNALGQLATLLQTWDENQLVFGNASGGLEQSSDLRWTDTQLVILGGYPGHTSQGEGVFVYGNVGLSGGFSDQYVDTSEWYTLGTTLTIPLFSSATQWTEAYQFLSNSVGSVWDLISTAAAMGGSGGTLDDAYDYGGSGAGNTITADSGAVVIINQDVTTPDSVNLALVRSSTVGPLSNDVPILSISYGYPDIIGIEFSGGAGDDLDSVGYQIAADGATRYSADFDTHGSTYIHQRCYTAEGPYTPEIEILADGDGTIEGHYSRVLVNAGELNLFSTDNIQIECDTLYIDSADFAVYLNQASLLDIRNLTFDSTAGSTFASNTLTIDLENGSQIQNSSLTAACTSVIISGNMPGPGVYYELVYASGAARTITGFPSGWKWDGNYNLSLDTLTIPVGTTLRIVILYDGTTYRGQAVFEI